MVVKANTLVFRIPKVSKGRATVLRGFSQQSHLIQSFCRAIVDLNQIESNGHRDARPATRDSRSRPRRPPAGFDLRQ